MSEQHWVRICPVARLKLGEPLAFDHEGRSYVLYRLSSGCYASEARCTHEDADLAEGTIIDDQIECPLHQGRFDIRTGKALCLPVEVDLAVYPVRENEGQIEISVPKMDEN